MKSLERNNALDLLRIIATVLILFHHYQQLTGAFFEGHVNFYGGKFYFGYMVEFFFILSGFFMYRYIEKIQSGLSFKNFIVKRIIRLLPLVAIAAATHEVLLWYYTVICGQNWFDRHVNIWGAIVDAAGLQDGWGFSNPMVNNPTWYISVLILCYVLFFFLTYVSMRTNIPALYLYAFMVLFGSGISTYSISIPFLNGSSARGYYAFFFGILLAHCLSKHKVTLGSCITSAAIVAALTWVFFNHHEWTDDGINFLLTFVYYPALIIAFSYKPVYTVLNRKIFGFFGKVTYDVYVWHVPNLLIMFILNYKAGLPIYTSSRRPMAIFAAICFIAGTVSHLLIEKPLTNFITSKIQKQNVKNPES